MQVLAGDFREIFHVCGAINIKEGERRARGERLRRIVRAGRVEMLERVALRDRQCVQGESGEAQGETTGRVDTGTEKVSLARAAHPLHSPRT